MWLVLHKRILTKEVMRQWEGGEGICDRCKKGREDILHVLQDCPYAKIVWRRLVPYERRAQFFSKSWQRWIHDNCSHTGSKGEEHQWLEIFAVCCWFLWKWRNLHLHNHDFKIPWPAKVLIKKHVSESRKRVVKEDGTHRQEKIIMISWQKQEKGWCKLNVDGRLSISGDAGCGGAIRGDCGEWLRGLSMALSV